MNISDLPEVMTVDELRVFLKIGRNKAYRLVKSGEIEVLYIGSTIRITRTALWNYIKHAPKAEVSP